MKYLKQKITTLILLSIVLFSCETNDVKNDQPTLSDAEKNRIVSLLETDFSAKSDTPVKFESSKVIKIDGIYYMRSHHGEKVTTTLLKTDNNKLTFDGISCTTVSCASSSTGCVPNKKSGCTKCTEGTKDCTRTISG